MGKHSDGAPDRAGLGEFFKGLVSGRKDGRHTTPPTAAGILQSAGRKPVAAAIAVPTLAAAAVVGIGVGSQQGGGDVQVTSQGAVADVQPLNAKAAGEKQPKAATRKAAKSGKYSSELQTPAPKKTEDSGSSGSGSKDSGSSGSSGPGGKKNSSSSGKGGTCKASYYDTGEGTANGETSSTWTAANKTLPFNSHVKLTNVKNGKSVTVRVNDRGPYVSGRCFDISPHAMSVLGGDGVATVKWKVL